MTVFSGYMWTVRQTGGKKIRFQTGTDACGRGLNETKYCEIDKKKISCASMKFLFFCEIYNTRINVTRNLYITPCITKRKQCL